VATKKENIDPSAELANLLKKLLVLQLFELGVPQGGIAKKLRMDLHKVNDFLKGIRREHARKPAKQP